MLIQWSELVAKPGKGGVLRQTVTEMRDVLSSVSGTEWWAWIAFAGRPYGSFALSTRHSGYGAMLGGLLQLGANSEWAEIAASADGVLDHPADTRLNEVIAVTGEPTAPKQFTTVTRATLSGIDIGRATAWSLEVAEYVSKLTGHSAMVTTAAAGTMFQVHWLSGVDTVEELEAANTAIGGDAGYLEMLAEAGSARWFVEGSTDRALLARLP